MVRLLAARTKLSFESALVKFATGAAATVNLGEGDEGVLTDGVVELFLGLGGLLLRLGLELGVRELIDHQINNIIMVWGYGDRQGNIQ